MSLVKTYQTILLVRKPMSNPFAACSGSPPQCSTFSNYVHRKVVEGSAEGITGCVVHVDMLG